MKKIFTFSLAILVNSILWSQSHNIDDGDINDCSFTFYDSGGAGGNFGANEDHVITICPDVAGQYISLNFTSFELENGGDYMLIVDGGPSGNVVSGHTGTNTPGTFTSSDASGCVTIRFISDNNQHKLGWAATVTCVPAPGVDLGIASSPQDCNGEGGSVICSDAVLSGNSSGAGNLNDLGTIYSDDGCLVGENQSSWYYFGLNTGGTFGFDLNPAAGDDYDFAIWGPYPDIACPIVTGDAPLRCSYAAGSANTGLDNSTVETSENAFGDGWVSEITGVAGDTYVMVIDNYSATGNPFDLTWNLTGGASLDCTVLPVEFLDFSGVKLENQNKLSWITGSERNSDYFIVERSIDGGVFTPISEKIEGAGNTTETNFYSFIEENPAEGTSYYRIKQYDFDGKMTSTEVIALDRSSVEIGDCEIYPNPFVDNVKIKFNLSVDQNVSIQFVNQLGNVVKAETFDCKSGGNKIDLNTPISSGVYMVKIISENGELNQTKRVVKN